MTQTHRERVFPEAVHKYCSRDINLRCLEHFPYFVQSPRTFSLQKLRAHTDGRNQSRYRRKHHIHNKYIFSPSFYSKSNLVFKYLCGLIRIGPNLKEGFIKGNFGSLYLGTRAKKLKLFPTPEANFLTSSNLTSRMFFSNS